MANRIYPEDPFHFAPLWDAILDVYDVFSEICTKHNLRHYVIGGTLLGAVRHKGFIPWDDDFDLAMPRQDYERLKELLDSELPPHLKFMDHGNTPEFKFHFGKILDVREDLVLRVEKEICHELSNGIFIDIFPVDGYPDSIIGSAMVRASELVHNLVRYSKAYGKNGFGMSSKRRVARTFGKVAAPLLAPFVKNVTDDEIWFKWNEDHGREIPFSDDHMTGTLGCAEGRFQLVFRRNIFGTPSDVDFCGMKVPAPRDWDGFLRVNYNANYMTPPPEDKRRPTHEYSSRCPWWLGPTNNSRPK